MAMCEPVPVPVLQSAKLMTATCDLLIEPHLTQSRSLLYGSVERRLPPMGCSIRHGGTRSWRQSSALRYLTRTCPGRQLALDGLYRVQLSLCGICRQSGEDIILCWMKLVHRTGIGMWPALNSQNLISRMLVCCSQFSMEVDS